MTALALSQHDLQLTCLEGVEIAIDLHLLGVEAQELLLVLFDVPGAGLVGREEAGFRIVSAILTHSKLFHRAIVRGNLRQPREWIAVLVLAPGVLFEDDLTDVARQFILLIVVELGESDSPIETVLLVAKNVTIGEVKIFGGL